EADLNIDLHSYGRAIFCRWGESPLPNRLDGLVIKSYAKRSRHLDFLRHPLGVHHQRQDASAFISQLASLIRVFRIAIISKPRRLDRVPDAIDARFSLLRGGVIAGMQRRELRAD